MTVGFNRSRSATAIVTRWPEAFLGSFPKGMHSPMTLGFNRSRSATAIMTRWPEAFSKIVAEGDALAYDVRV